MSMAMCMGVSSASGVRVCDARDCRRPPRHTVRVWWGPHRADPARVCSEHRRELELAGLVEDPMGCPVAGCAQVVGSGRRMCPSHTEEARKLGHTVPQRGAIPRDLLLTLGRAQRAVVVPAEWVPAELVLTDVQAMAAVLGLGVTATWTECLDQVGKVLERAEAYRLDLDLANEQLRELRRRIEGLHEEVRMGGEREGHLTEELQALRDQRRQMEGAAEMREQALLATSQEIERLNVRAAEWSAAAAAQRESDIAEGYARAAQQLGHLLEFSPHAAGALGRAVAEAVVVGHGDRDLCRRRLAQLPGLMAELGGPSDGLYRPRAELVLQMVLPGLGDGEAPRPRVGEQAAALAGRVWRVDLHPSHWVGPVTALGGELLQVSDLKGGEHVFSARNPHLRTSAVSDQEWEKLKKAEVEQIARDREIYGEIPW